MSGCGSGERESELVIEYGTLPVLRQDFFHYAAHVQEQYAHDFSRNKEASSGRQRGLDRESHASTVRLHPI